MGAPPTTACWSCSRSESWRPSASAAQPRGHRAMPGTHRHLDLPLQLSLGSFSLTAGRPGQAPPALGRRALGAQDPGRVAGSAPFPSLTMNVDVKAPSTSVPSAPHFRRGGEAPLSRGLSEGFPLAYCRVVSRVCEVRRGRAPGLVAFLTHPRSLLSRTAASGSAACTCCSGASSCCTNMSPVGWSR